MPDLSIGEVARRAGVSASAIRYWERRRLLAAPPRRAGRRCYDPAVVTRLKQVAAARRASLAIQHRRRTMDWELEFKLGGVELEVKGWRGLATLTGLILVGAAVLQELRLPREQRAWHGALFGSSPYDLRPPTFDRLARTVWNPDQDAVLVPTAFGVGWSINAAAAVRFLGGRKGPATV